MMALGKALSNAVRRSRFLFFERIAFLVISAIDQVDITSKGGSGFIRQWDAHESILADIISPEHPLKNLFQGLRTVEAGA